MAQSILDSIFSGDTGVAKTLINLLGAGGTFTVPNGDESYDPLTGQTIAGGETSVPLDLAALEDVTDKDVNGTTVLKGDFKCILPKSDLTLRREYIQKAVLTFNGVEYKLVEYMTIHSGQEIAAYTAFLRNL